MLGILFAFLAIPTETKAGFFSSIFGEDAYADVTTIDPTQSGQNSQTMALLQAKVSSVPTFQDKNDKTDQIDESVNVNIVSDNALLPTATPMGVFEDMGSGDFSFDQISVYVVRNGDTVSQVADIFGVSADTILSANDMKKGDKLKEGDVLLILPFSGVEHIVAKGQTLQGIANLYKVDINEILISNDVDLNTKIAAGEKLMIPGGSLPGETGKSPSKSVAKSLPSTSISTPGKSANGYFINPVPSGKRTRGISSSHRGVDFGAPTGSPIRASASGRIKFARTGYNGGFGTMIIISHSNGTETLYGHMSKLGTSVGDQVDQGEVIGYVGSTGRSTGPHLHFEVHGAKNPF